MLGWRKACSDTVNDHYNDPATEGTSGEGELLCTNDELIYGKLGGSHPY